MSALYWNFVSQKVDNVRGEFDKIVNKESEFQNVMYNFYKPSSNDLAGEIKQQKDLIDELKKSMNEAQGTTKEKASTAEEAKNTLKEFIETVERYKEYQENQKKLLLAAQDSTQQQIRTGLDAIQAQQKANQFSERMSGLATGISQAKTQLGQTSNVLANAQQIREGQVSQQELGMAKIQSNLIEQYQAASRQAALNQVYELLVPARQALTVAKGDDPVIDDGSDNNDKDKDPKEEDPEELKIDLEKQREELKNIAADIQDISDNLKEPEKEDPTPEDPGTEPDDPSTDNPEKPDDGAVQSPMIHRVTQGTTITAVILVMTDKRTAVLRIKTSRREQTVRSRTVMPLMVRPTADKPKRAHLPNRLHLLIQPFNLSSWQMKAEPEIQEIPVAAKIRRSLGTKINQETMTFLISPKQKNSSAKRLSELSKLKKN